MNPDKIKVLISSKNPSLSKGILSVWQDYFVESDFSYYPNGEISVKVNEKLERKIVYILHIMTGPLHDSFMHLLFLINKIYRQSPSAVHVILPYLPYARQDNPDLIIKLLAGAGASSLITFDVHSQELSDSLPIPVHQLSFENAITQDCLKRRVKDYVIVSPDKGGTVRAQSLAARLGVPFIGVTKQRNGPGDATVTAINGDILNKHCLIFDDIADSGNTLCTAAEALLNAGAVSCEAYVTHCLLSEAGFSRIQASLLNGLTVSNTLTFPDVLPSKIRSLSVAADILSFIENTSY